MFRESLAFCIFYKGFPSLSLPKYLSSITEFFCCCLHLSVVFEITLLLPIVFELSCLLLFYFYNIYYFSPFKIYFTSRSLFILPKSFPLSSLSFSERVKVALDITLSWHIKSLRGYMLLFPLRPDRAAQLGEQIPQRSNSFRNSPLSSLGLTRRLNYISPACVWADLVLAHVCTLVGGSVSESKQEWSSCRVPLLFGALIPPLALP